MIPEEGSTAGIPLNYQLVAPEGLWTFHASRLAEKERNRHFGNGTINSDHQEAGRKLSRSENVEGYVWRPRDPLGCLGTLLASWTANEQMQQSRPEERPVTVG